MAWKRAGFSRNSLISCSSSTASSHPATSAKVTFGLVLRHLAGLGLAELHHPAAAALHRVHEEEEDADEEQRSGSRLNSSDVQMRLLLLVDLDVDRRARRRCSSVVSSSAYSCGKATLYSLPSVELAVDLVRAVLDRGRRRPRRRRWPAWNSVRVSSFGLVAAGAASCEAHEQGDGAEERRRRGWRGRVASRCGEATGQAPSAVSLEHADVREVAVPLGDVEAVADDELGRDAEADVPQVLRRSSAGPPARAGRTPRGWPGRGPARLRAQVATA